MDPCLKKIIDECNIDALRVLRAIDEDLIQINDSFRMACGGKHIDLVLWFLENYQDLDASEIDSYGTIEIFELLIDNVKLNDRLFIEGFEMACLGGHIDLLNKILIIKPDLAEYLIPWLGSESTMIDILNHPFSLLREEWIYKCFVAACTDSKFGAADKLIEVFGRQLIYTKCYEFCLEFAIKNSKKDILYYLTHNFSHQINFHDVTKKISDECKK
jgi:hypothetical protein